MNMLQAALAAQQQGFHIFPVARNAKVPHPAAGKWGETSTNDINAIIHFWTRVDPLANIGIACKPSQLLVVDLDQAKEDGNLGKTEWSYLHAGYGPRVSGLELIDEMAYKLSDSDDFSLDFDTYTTITGSGGRHLYYRWPAHWPRISQASPVKGVIDVRGNGGTDGGYVLGEGSVTDAGPYKRYLNSPIALPPQWIRQLVAERPQQAPVRRPQGIRQPGAISWSGLVESVRQAGVGNRNNALLWAARTMYSDRASIQECQDTLGPAAEAAGLGMFEITRTIQSAYAAQQRKEG
jgi:hypothetical protein